MLAAAGIVVTEISTPTSAPDLAEVRDSTPAAPASAATIAVKWSGVRDELRKRVAVLRESWGIRPGRVEQEGEPGGWRRSPGESRRRAPSASASTRSPRLWTTATQSPANGPNSGPDHHRADDQDDCVGEDPDRRDQGRDDHEGEEARRELDVLRGAGLDLLPDHGVRRQAAARPSRRARRPRRSASRCPPSRSNPRGRSRARAGRTRSRWRPRARRRPGSRRPRGAAPPARGRSGCRPTACARAGRARAASGGSERRSAGEPFSGT